jgi:hypothetical protein
VAGFENQRRASLALFRRRDGSLHAGLLAAFVFVNGLALANAALHDPRVGYDAGQHLSYILTLAKAHTPSFVEGGTQSFTPPLSYALPALLLRVMVEAGGDDDVLKSDLLSQDSDAVGTPRADGGERRSRFLLLGVAAKFAQLLNWLFSVGLTLCVLKTCELIRPGEAAFKFWSLLTLGMLPVYYKTFSFVRAEPLGALLVAAAAYQFLRMLLAKDFGARRALTLGLLIGLAILARQWSFLILPAFACSTLLTLRSRTRRENRAFASALAAAVLTAALVGGWFYLSYPWAEARPGRMGSYMANVSGDSYWTQVSALSLSVGDERLFTTPVRDALADEVIPIFYSETWGDYWGYFVTGKSNQPEGVRRYLGRVNLVSLLPTAALLAGLGFGVYSLFSNSLGARVGAGEGAACGSLCLLVAWSFIGYAYFLAAQPNTGHGTVVKATYMLQAFPFVSILAARVLEMLGRRSQRLSLCAGLLLVCVTLHNLPAMVTHYFVTGGRQHLAW